MRSKIALLILIPFLAGCTGQALSPVTQLPQAEQSRPAQSIHSTGGTFTPIDNPNAVGGFGTEVWGINPQGDVVGNYFDGNGALHGFLWHDGAYTTIDDPNGGNGFNQGTEATGISASGEIVGSYIDNSNNVHGFSFRGGRFTTIDDPVGVGTGVHAITANGHIVGDYFDSASSRHGFLFDGHKYTTIDVPGAPLGAGCGTVASGINPRGDIVLYTLICGATQNHAFLLHHGQFTSIDDPSASGQGTIAFGIGSQGIMVGGYNVDNGNNSYGFILCDGVYTTLNNPLNVNGNELTNISPSGDIIGLYVDANFLVHGFLYHPVSGARRGNCDEGGTTASLARHIMGIPVHSGHHGLLLPAIDQIR